MLRFMFRVSYWANFALQPFGLMLCVNFETSDEPDAPFEPKFSGLSVMRRPTPVELKRGTYGVPDRGSS